jgi:hypothetical protein
MQPSAPPPPAGLFPGDRPPQEAPQCGCPAPVHSAPPPPQQMNSAPPTAPYTGGPVPPTAPYTGGPMPPTAPYAGGPMPPTAPCTGGPYTGGPYTGVPVGMAMPYTAPMANPQMQGAVFVMQPQQQGGWDTRPQQVNCPYCRFSGFTTVRHEPGTGTWLVCICLFVFFWPLSCLPFCVDDMQDAVHYCASCGARMGRSKFL